jgi:hypothetical protein
MNKKIYLKGDGSVETGRKIIKYLESLEGINREGLAGTGGVGAVSGYYISNTTIVYQPVPPNYTFLDINNLPNTTEEKVNLVECFERILKNIKANGTE